MGREILENRIISEDMEKIYASRKTWSDLGGKSLYIAGAAGMIASYLVYFLICLNEKKDVRCRIYAGVRSEEKARERFGEYVDRDYFELVKADVCAKPETGRRYDYIIHAASLASPQYYGGRPADVMLPNLVGTYRLLEHAKKYGCDSFVFFSSGSVYGSVGEAGSIREEMAGRLDYLAPGNCYGESKRAGEALCEAYLRQYGVGAKIVRIFHTYGPTMDIDNDARVFAEFVRNAVNGEDIVMKSDGSASRAFCYLTDTAAAVFRVLLEGENGACYNVGNPKESLSIAQLAELMVSLSPRGLSVRREERQEKGYQAGQERKTAVPDISKLRQLGWEPEIPAKDGFERCIRYFESLGR